MSTFNLLDYTEQIVSMAETRNLTAQDAVEHFVTNLATMSDFHSGAESLNFRALGQSWNSLNYKIRNKQKAEAVATVSKKLFPAAKSRRGV